MSHVDPALVRDVDLLCLDAGNTVIFLDHARLAAFVSREGFACDAAALIRAEGEAKHLAVDGALVDFVWEGHEAPGAIGWGRTVGTILTRAGVPERALPPLVEKLWKEHVRHNFWSLVPEGLGDALDAARTRGVKVAIVSNSEGMLDVLFETLGVARHFDLVVDSGKVGVEKPDPRIFGFALDHFRVPASRALMLGDNYATDVVGARAAGMRVAFIDPYAHWEGRHLDVPRVPGVVAVARALVRCRA